MEYFQIWFDEITGRFLMESNQTYFAITNTNQTIIRIYKKRTHALQDLLQSGIRSQTHLVKITN